MTFNLPLPVRVPEGIAGRCDVPAVYKARVPAYAYETPECPRPDERAEPRFPEVIGESVTPGTGPPVYHHHLGSVVRYGGRLGILEITHRPEIEVGPIQ